MKSEFGLHEKLRLLHSYSSKYEESVYQVAWYIFTNTLKEYAASIFRVEGHCSTHKMGAARSS